MSEPIEAEQRDDPIPSSNDGMFSPSYFREMSYRAEADPLFFMEQAGEVPAGTWLAKRAEIQARHADTSPAVPAQHLPPSKALSTLLPAGMIMITALNTAPKGWLICDGRAVSRTTHAALFATIRTTYGAGNGSSTFNLPNLPDIVLPDTNTLRYLIKT